MGHQARFPSLVVTSDFTVTGDASGAGGGCGPDGTRGIPHFTPGPDSGMKTVLSCLRSLSRNAPLTSAGRREAAGPGVVATDDRASRSRTPQHCTPVVLVLWEHIPNLWETRVYLPPLPLCVTPSHLERGPGQDPDSPTGNARSPLVPAVSARLGTAS